MKKVIIDTDWGGDPDDILTLDYAFQTEGIEVASVITADEYKGNHRANVLISWLKTHNLDIPVFSGTDLGNTNIFFLDKYYKEDIKPDSLFDSPKLKAIIEDVAASNGYLLGVGGFSNIDFLNKNNPDALKKMQIYVMGGAYKYNPPTQAEHNIFMNVEAAKNIFFSGLPVHWVSWEVTCNMDISISKKHALYDAVSKSQDVYYRMTKENMDGFYDNIYPFSYLNDPLTLNCIFDDNVTFVKEKVIFHEDGRWSPGEDGHEIILSKSANYETFMRDFTQKCVEKVS